MPLGQAAIALGLEADLGDLPLILTAQELCRATDPDLASRNGLTGAEQRARTQQGQGLVDDAGRGRQVGAHAHPDAGGAASSISVSLTTTVPAVEEATVLRPLFVALLKPLA